METVTDKGAGTVEYILTQQGATSRNKLLCFTVFGIVLYLLAHGHDVEVYMSLLIVFIQ